MKRKVIPVILCGGIGSRLWPLSRSSFPKQFLSILKEEKRSLLQQTYQRISNVENISAPIIICNEEHRFIVAEQMREIKVNPLAIILEPVGRNTCPAITIGALKALEENGDSIILVLSADHKIDDNIEFVKTINNAYFYAEKGRLVTFGVVPTSPETGYGYIEGENLFDKETIKGVKIKKFVEKPDIKTAEKLYQDKKYSWNSGIFMFRSKIILNEIEKKSPTIYDLCTKAILNSSKDLDFIRIGKGIFEECSNISIDVAVLEHTDLGTVLPLNVGWSDIGSWKSLWETEKKDKNGNIIDGQIIYRNTKDCYLRSNEKLVVALGIDNLVIVDTPDALLVANKNNTNEIKNIVDELKKKNIYAGTKHQKVYRPWGNYISLVEDLRWQVKRIEVKSGAKLSLQLHHHRAEHWIVVNGTAKVEINEKLQLLSENQSTYIPVGAKHRLSNPGKIPLVLIEVQSGSYLGEDDIKRFEDNYGRANY